MGKLLSRPIRNEDECIASYLIRVSELNGFGHLGHLLKHGRLPWKNNRAPIHEIVTAKYSIEPYFNNLGLLYTKPLTAVVRDTFIKGSSSPYIFTKYPKVCPSCLNELGYCRASWNFLPIVACPIHKTILVDQHPSLDKRLSWYRSHLDRFDKSLESTIGAAENASEEAIEISSLFEELQHGNPRKQQTSEPLSNLNFSEALTSLNFITHCIYKLKTNKRYSPDFINKH